MLIKRPADIPAAEITPEALYMDRRSFIGTSGRAVLGAPKSGARPGAAYAESHGRTLLARVFSGKPAVDGMQRAAGPLPRPGKPTLNKR